MDQNALVEMENLFLALSDRTRIQLLGLIGSKEVSVGYLCDSLGQSQPKISRHLAYLRSSGLVSTRRDGKWIYYKIEPPSHMSGQALLASALNWISGGEEASLVSPSSGEKGHPTRECAEDEIGSDFIPNEIEIYLL